jgi:erythromycin esterase-like protein
MRTERAGFYGLDVYSFFESIDEVVNYLKKNNLPLAQEIQRRYACLDPFEGDEISYARSLLKYPPGCENEVLLNLQRLLELRVKDVAQDGDELFSSQQNARIVANAETYYRAMLSGDASSWNVRDGHMMETLDRLLERAGEGAKAIVWAHNTHIGDYRATDMKEAGYINLGGLARQSYGEENVALVGFGTYQGEVLAGSGWGRPEEIMPLPAAHEESYEYHFHRAAQNHNLNQFYLLLENKTHTPFAHRLGHRAIGVVYDPRHERRGNYVPTELSKRYDAFVFVDQTHALKSLHTAYVLGEFPETWPTGQ